MATLYEDLFTRVIIRSSVLLRMRNISDNNFREKAPILYSVTFCEKSWRLRENVETYGTANQAIDENTIRRISFACGTTKATNIQAEYVIFIDFPM